MYRRRAILLSVFFCFASASGVQAQRNRHILFNEQGSIQVRDAAQLVPSTIPDTPTPPTVATPYDELPVRELSLDEAIQIALQNADVVRVLSGIGAASAGITIYSPAISNASVDQARAAFDPNLTAQHNFFRNETPFGLLDPLDPTRAIIQGSRSDAYDFNLDLNKRTTSGANAGLRITTNRNRNQPGILPLNPRATSSVDLSFAQPLLRGRGADVNAVPIVLALLDTERSYFRLKDSLQNLVLGVIQGYWDLVQARTELWVIEQQIRQASFVNELNEVRFDPQISSADVGEVAQSRATLANFRAQLVAAENNVLSRVASLRGILGLPPSSDFTIVPITPPFKENITFEWDALLRLAELRRPDLVELKLVLEADQQRILQSRNFAQPQLDATALYRWNGLEGEMPVGDRITADPGEHTDWAFGVTFSVPLTLRSERATLRQNELLLAQDRANLTQGLLQATHRIAFTLRNLDQLKRQYGVYQEAREAAAVSLEQRFEAYRVGKTNFVDVLLAINTWASSVTNEAASVTQYNSILASLELETGTILETHGIRTVEERYCSLGPLGGWGKGREYPAAMRPTENAERYPTGTVPAEETFDLTSPVEPRAKESRIQRIDDHSLPFR